MASTRDIRRRIKSVKNTRQITRAMELVAASKMKRAQQATLAGRPYAQLMAQMLASLATRADGAQHPFLEKREVKMRGILLLTTNIGLCGALNANLFKLVGEVQGAAKFVAIGRKGAQYLARTKRDLIAEFVVDDRASFNDVKVAIEFMTERFLAGEIDTIEVIYPRFKNTLVQTPLLRPILPLTNVRDFAATLEAETGVCGALPRDDREMLFEPDAPRVLAALLPFYVNRFIHQLVLSAKASEFSARMVAMKTAKDNASKLLDDLTLEYNKARQAAITQEILEIAAAQYVAA
ncbi:ATP synthase subunit gamma [Cephaloticoccus primus]|uniref:ATP synthase gamma chain n=1 Tax=Cephaloticoccus primus TaxID=1548207 RepID=A0A139SHY4_9BACT|nr:ATP synthase F1 subunit gamma [Cephaloticoccus primus]KXU34131.1 ATP synthase subunit gamma [Cephaloticoccus primus]